MNFAQILDTASGTWRLGASLTAPRANTRAVATAGLPIPSLHLQAHANYVMQI